MGPEQPSSRHSPPGKVSRTDGSVSEPVVAVDDGRGPRSPRRLRPGRLRVRSGDPRRLAAPRQRPPRATRGRSGVRTSRDGRVDVPELRQRPRRKLGVADLRLASASTGWTLVRPPTAVRVAKRRVCRLAVAQRSHPQLGDRADHRRRIAPPQLGLGPGQRHARSAGTPPISGASVSDQEFPPV